MLKTLPTLAKRFSQDPPPTFLVKQKMGFKAHFLLDWHLLLLFF